MKILIASTNDYANLGHNTAKALRAVGVECTDICLARHLSKYESHSKFVSVDELKQLIRTHDHILIMHTDPFILNHVKDACKPYSVYHTGSRYRDNPNKFNEAFIDAKYILSDQTEFSSVCPKMNYVVSAMESFEFIKPPKRERLVIGHFPSLESTKGTEKIRELLKPFSSIFEVRIDTKKVSHTENLKRIQDVDIYVELFQTHIKGREYGCFGVTAIEAAMMGKAVVTMDLEFNSHIKTYGSHPFLIANTETDFNYILKEISFKQEIDHAGIKKLAESYYSFESTGNRLKKIFGLRDWPKVSVLIPFNKDRGWLKDAKESVYAQRYGGEIELLCSDNLVEGHENFNVSKNINELFKSATGKYIKFLPEDDLLTPNCIHDSVVAIESQGVDFIHANSYILKQNDSVDWDNLERLPIQKLKQTLQTLSHHCSGWYIHGLTLLYKREVFEAIRFDETLTCSEENDFNLHAMSKGFVLGYLDKTVCIYRRHDTQKSLGKGVDQKRRYREVEMIRSRYRKSKK